MFLFSWLAPFRLRLLFRFAFLLLAFATVALALFVLQQEKQVSYNNYQINFKKSQQQISATLRHPAGQLALLNPPSSNNAQQVNLNSSAVRPILLPFSAIDFDDQSKAQQAMVMSGCMIQYGNDGSLCVGIGNDPWAGAYIYVAGSFVSSTLVSHERGEKDLSLSHRAFVKVHMPEESHIWIAPFEAEPPTRKILGAWGRLTGFLPEDLERNKAKPVKDFRAWIWQKLACSEPQVLDTDGQCKKDVFFSMRLPITVWQEALFEQKRIQWPPENLDQIGVELSVLPPNGEQPILTTKRAPTSAPFALSELQSSLLPGETLRIEKINRRSTNKNLDGNKNTELIALAGQVAQTDEYWNLLSRVIRRLPVEDYNPKLESSEIIATPLGSYQVILKGDIRSVNKSLSVVATRVSWFVGAMLLALFVAWLVIEIGIIHRITLLTKRADALSKTDFNSGGLDRFDVSDLRNRDELGVLATGLHNLFRRVQEDVKREAIRAEQEKDMWHAVGHEIMSPLQSLMVLHGGAGDSNENPSARYIHRMQQAVKVLYGSASPSEAFQSTVLQITEIDLVAFLKHIAENAPCVGIEKVEFNSTLNQLMARADEYSLEDVITHVLGNAERYRAENTAIEISLSHTETEAIIHIHNQGPQIETTMLDKIFEYGVSDQPDSGAQGNRGQGLFVAKTYMAKMGGTIAAGNVEDGVTFILRLQLIDKN